MRCLFATHYHVLGDEVRNCREILNYHMDAMVDEEKQTVTSAPGRVVTSRGVGMSGKNCDGYHLSAV